MPKKRPAHLTGGQYAITKTRYVRDVLAQARLRQGCAACGYNRNAGALDFHHYKGVKFMGVTRMVTYSWERIMDEVRKCVVLCKNCHVEHG